MPIEQDERVRLRPLERGDLHFVHRLNNNDSIMRYWFEEPYETLAELTQLYDDHIRDQRERRFIVEKAELTQLYDDHIRDQRERRFIVENHDADMVGLVELIEIDHVHRRGEFQIIIAPDWQQRGYASSATRLAVAYAFRVLNLRKLYLVVDVENVAAISIYEKCGFVTEGRLHEEFFANGAYRSALRMAIFQHQFLGQRLD